MTATSEEYRNALRHFPSGVTIVTIRAGAERHGLTVSAFASVSPEPPLILIMIDNRHRAQEMMEEEGTVFAVNILREGQEEMSNRFAWLKEGDRFAEGDWREATTGAPVLNDALAWLDCTIYSRATAGTHTIYVGEVQEVGVPYPDEAPLVFWNRGYRLLGGSGE